MDGHLYRLWRATSTDQETTNKDYVECCETDGYYITLSCLLGNIGQCLSSEAAISGISLGGAHAT